ncbi:hypothetical protein [Streptantibioticus silvisoli]|nr:hypothetical protein [Streptantibioticus silvisoli]MDI5963248.1 hypothetical protein [Streptantibioticus silvisoli]
MCFEGAAVLDSGALYSVANSHTPEGARLNDTSLSGALRLITPMVAFSNCCGMRMCWEADCSREHVADPQLGLHAFHDRHGFEIVQPSIGFALQAGTLYGRCAEQHVVGSEVLSSCHAALLAKRENLPLVSVEDARYCYVPIPGLESIPVDFV